MIALQNVSKTFIMKNKLVEAVKQVSLQIEDGQIYGIIGFSGAGKSTLVRLINLLERPTDGKVFLDNIELTALNEKNLREARKNIGMIFQSFNLFASRNVFENVAYPLRYMGYSKSYIEERVHELLDLVDLSDKELAYPSQLSGGQKQRVAIARALASKPKVLLCDEATSALDPQTTKSILKLLKKLNEELGLTIVIITHEMQVVKEICHQVAVMENGYVVETGDIFSVFARPQQKVTQDFINVTSSLHKIDELLEEDSSIVTLEANQCLVKLKYLQGMISEPIISGISTQFKLIVNIIFADIELINGMPLGGTVVIIEGETENILAALQYLRDKQVGVEVLKDVRNV